MVRPVAKSPDAAVERRVPPHSQEAEMAVLGGVLLRNEALDQVRDLLDPEDFYQPAHQRLFRSMAALYDRGDPIDPITLRQHLKEQNWLDEVGGKEYIDRLLDEVHTTANIEQYARIVADKSTLRRLLTATFEMQAMVYEGKDDQGTDLETAQIVDQSQAKVFDVARDVVQSPYESLEEIIHASLAYVDERMATGGALAGYSTGFSDLDHKTNGVKPGELIIVAARPAMGKTSLALNIATNIAVAEQKPVLLFSLEMSAAQLGLRLLCAQARVNLGSVLKGHTTEDQYQKLAEAAALLAEAPFFIDDSGGTTTTSIRSKARRLRAEQGDLGLVVIDYIQLLGSSRFYDSREREISTMSRTLKMMAKELKCPVLALSQLNRQLENRPDKRPRPSDLRESGALEQDADMILFIYRDVIYNAETEEPDVAELIIGKQRSGPTGTVKLIFLDEYTRFEQYAGVSDY
ncbi:MAG TPA: replicative DNA helicase [bacterium]|nr:replicative DNA helicase [bacterium]